jgi:WD40 repeat protein
MQMLRAALSPLILLASPGTSAYAQVLRPAAVPRAPLVFVHAPAPRLNLSLTPALSAPTLTLPAARLPVPGALPQAAAATRVDRAVAAELPLPSPLAQAGEGTGKKQAQQPVLTALSEGAQAVAKSAEPGKATALENIFSGSAARGAVNAVAEPASAPDTDWSGEILLIQTLPAEDGRRGTGHDQSKRLEQLVKDKAGKLKSLDRDGPFSLFQETFAVEVKAEAKAEILAELQAVPGIEFHPLSELLGKAARRQPRPLPDPGAIAPRIEKGTLAGRLEAFADLASALEAATPEQVAAIPAADRDALAMALYGVAGLAVNTFNLVQGAARQDLRKRLHDADPEVKGGWAALEKAAQQGLKAPAVRARFAPLKTLLLRALGAMNRLDTPAARDFVLQLLPHAEHTGLEYVAFSPSRRTRYVRHWLDSVTGSVDETLAGLRLGAQRPEGWTGSNRSGGYTHVEGRRQSTHLYKWKRERFDPGEMKHELLLTLGMPGGAALVEQLLTALEEVQPKISEIDALNRANRLLEELTNVERNVAYYVSQAEQAGRPLTPEQIEGIRRSLTEQVESRAEKIDGHSVVDRLLASLGYNSFNADIPGYDESAYVANALRFFTAAVARLSEPGLVRQLAEAAVAFLTDVAGRPVLGDGLRVQAVSAWRALAEKARALGIGLNTRLDGVIDPRPQTLLGEPTRLPDAGAETTVWQLAASPDGRYLARAAGDRTVRIWDARTGALAKTIKLEDARQLYGDLANSLGVAWTSEGRLLVTTLHDGEADGKKFAYNLVRSFDLDAPADVLLPADALTTAELRDVYVLREMAEGPAGPFYATMRELRNEQHHYLGAEVRLVGADGAALALIEGATLLDMRGGTLLTAAPGKSTPALGLWDVSDPAHPADVTPGWLTARVAAWRERNPRSEYGWWRAISAKLGSVAGRPALILHDEGRLALLDLETGAELSSLEIPNAWDVSPYAADAAGRYLAAVVKAPGQFSGPNPERLMVWDLSTGAVVMERDATYVPKGWIYSAGQSVAQLLFTPDGRLVAAGRQSVSVFDLP